MCPVVEVSTIVLEVPEAVSDRVWTRIERLISDSPVKIGNGRYRVSIVIPKCWLCVNPVVGNRPAQLGV